MRLVRGLRGSEVAIVSYGGLDAVVVLLVGGSKANLALLMGC